MSTHFSGSLMDAPQKTEIVLTTINARYIHAAVGLRYLLANLGELQSRARIVEFEIKQRAMEIAAELLALKPRIIGFGVYIWNTALTAEVAAIIKRVSPDIVVIFGGPEVSFEIDQQPLAAWADHIITGEADLKFAEVCRGILSGERHWPKVIVSELPSMDQVALPYDLYSSEDLAHRVLYVEASRGCPFTCEFCLSSLDVPVRAFDLERFLKALEDLLSRGARVFKFVDRTFNLNINTSRAILEFFLNRWQEGMFVHFEMVPDRMPKALLELLGRFPRGAVQLEVGIQTFDEETAKNISRRQNYAKLEENLRYLRSHTGVHVHADLIVGLPGESVESFGRGFDRLVAMEPQEIQVGILKRLRGTPIVRHDREWEMVYSPNAPYEILQNKLLSFDVIQRFRRFARFWDLFANSGRFTETLPSLWRDSASAFESFMKFSDWLGARLGRNHSIALVSLAEHLYRYLSEELAQSNVAIVLKRDWFRGGIKRERLPFLEDSPESANRTESVASPVVKVLPKGGAKRQQRHLSP
jgi:radical SAM superfamily enzyme YgiQ (UPF0313 family)